MSNVRTNNEKIQRFLFRQTKTPGWDFSDAPDPRREAQVEHKMPSLIWTYVLALISNQPTLRDVEVMTQELSPAGRALVQAPKSDTTLYEVVKRLETEYYLSKLVQQIRQWYRSKMLSPVLLPCGVVTVDGKNLATLDHDADGTGQKRTSDNGKWDQRTPEHKAAGKPYYLLPALRASLVSAATKPCIYQMAIPAGMGEAGICREFVEALVDSYGRGGMFEILDFDAGLCSLATAEAVDAHGYGYVFGLKGNQPELYQEAQRLMVQLTNELAPEEQSDWEPRNGTRMRRSLWRTGEMRGFINSAGTWSHLRQTWLVRQEKVYPDGRTEIEDRYFITSLPWNRLKPLQILVLVRNHWSIENDVFNSLDQQWKEDSAPWCTKGQAIWVLGLLRLMAYNAAQMLRRKCLCPKDESGQRTEPMSWRQLFKSIQRALEAQVAQTTLTPIG
jgi:hypothetical protein